MPNASRQSEEEHVRREEAERLLRWIRDNRSDWRLICRRDDLGDAQLYRLL
ncbi:MAG: hypothetical protein MRZ28_00755 [Oscillospiraceae bacterium]|nr:hypothetical protein [Oscillospiraceae bacterium]MDY3218203.1 hypothetical protein [Candidatus Fimivivens sp.]